MYVPHVIPVKTGIQRSFLDHEEVDGERLSLHHETWTPAFAGVTTPLGKARDFTMKRGLFVSLGGPNGIK